MQSHHEHAPSKHQEQQNDERGAYKARFLTDDGENEIVVRFRQISPFFSGIADAHSKQTSGGHGVFAMHRLIADPLHVGCGASLVCGHDTVESVRTGDNESANQNRTAACHDSQPFARKISQQQRGTCDREQNHGRAKILATHNQQQCKTKPRNQLEICLIWSDFVYLLLRVDQFPRQPYAQRKLNDFGGLEGKSKKADPTFVALDIDTQGGKRQRLQKQSDNQEDETDFSDKLRRNHHAGHTHNKSENAESTLLNRLRPRRLAIGDHIHRRAGKHHNHTENGENNHRDPKPVKTPNRIKQTSQTDITTKIVDPSFSRSLPPLTGTVTLLGSRLLHTHSPNAEPAARTGFHDRHTT